MFEYMRTSIICRYITTPDPDFALFWEKFSKKMKKAKHYG